MVRRVSKLVPSSLALLLGAYLCVACEHSHHGPSPAASAESTKSRAAPPTNTTITVLYTNDEHGWMEGQKPEQSVRHLLSQWEDEEGFTPDGPFVLLSGGDMWTGPAISTWVHGQSMVELMNSLGYDAAALGNHEFDFGREVLQQRASEASFPFLSANIRALTGQSQQQLGFRPWTMLQVFGVKIAVIGLTVKDTPQATHPRSVAGLQFDDYEPSLRKWLPVVRQHKPDLVFVVGHVCMKELEPLAEAVRDLRIALFGGGHCNELVAKEHAGAVLLEGGSHFSSYAWAKFTLDAPGAQLSARSFGKKVNHGALRASRLDPILSKWQQRADAELSRHVGYLARTLEPRSHALQQLVVQAGLAQVPGAQIYLLNPMAIRAPLPQGQVLLRHVVSALPFANNLILLQMSGAQLKGAIRKSTVLGGLSRKGAQLLSADGEPLDDARLYQVLTIDFLYDGGDGYTELKAADPHGIDTGLHYRDVLVEYLQSLGTSQAQPLSP